MSRWILDEILSEHLGDVGKIQCVLLIVRNNRRENYGRNVVLISGDES
jgi:hypothetical protein